MVEDGTDNSRAPRRAANFFSLKGGEDLKESRAS
jgi:hypothetical protein